jgi:hypothetical protein
VVGILDRESRSGIAAVGDLPLRSPGGTFVARKQVAHIFHAPGRYQVLHEGAQRVQTVVANVAGNDVASFVDAAKAALAARLEPAPGTRLQFSGTVEAQAQTRRDLAINSVIMGAGRTRGHGGSCVISNLTGGALAHPRRSPTPAQGERCIHIRFPENKESVFPCFSHGFHILHLI